MKLGDVAQQPLLNYFGQDQARRAPQLEALRAWIARLELAPADAAGDASGRDHGRGRGAGRRRRDRGRCAAADGRLTLQGRQPTNGGGRVGPGYGGIIK